MKLGVTWLDFFNVFKAKKKKKGGGVHNTQTNTVTNWINLFLAIIKKSQICSVTGEG